MKKMECFENGSKRLKRGPLVDGVPIRQFQCRNHNNSVKNCRKRKHSTSFNAPTLPLFSSSIYVFRTQMYPSMPCSPPLHSKQREIQRVTCRKGEMKTADRIKETTFRVAFPPSDFPRAHHFQPPISPKRPPKYPLHA